MCEYKNTTIEYSVGFGRVAERDNFGGRERDKKLLLQRHLLPEIDVDGFDIGVADEGVKLSAS